MGISRSAYYEEAVPAYDDTAIVEAIAAICEEFENYGSRRVRAELRHRGLMVNHKIRRLVREHNLQPRRRRRHVATTDSGHDEPIYPNRIKDLVVDGPNQLWNVAVIGGFAYVAVILDAWSRRAAGYAISRSIDVRLTLAALRPRSRCASRDLDAFITPIAARNMPPWHIGRPCFSTVSPARWAGVAIPTTTRWPKAS